MKTIIAGSRSGVTIERFLDEIVKCDWLDQITEVVSGRAKGVDQYGEMWARDIRLPVSYFPPDWEKYGRSAGFTRNEEMARYADAAIVIHNGSSGSQHMIRRAKFHDLVVFDVNIEKTSEKSAQALDFA